MLVYYIICLIVNIKELVQFLKDKRFNEMRKWVVKNLDKEGVTISDIGKKLSDYLHKDPIAHAY